MHMLCVLAKSGTQPVRAMFLFCLSAYTHGRFAGATHVGCFCSQLSMPADLSRSNRLTPHAEVSFVSCCLGNAKWA